MYTVDGCLGNEERGGGNEEGEKRGGASLRDQRVADTRPTVASSVPFSGPLGEEPPNGPTRNQKKPTKHHFSLTSKFLPPRRKQLPGAGAQGLLPPCRGSPGQAERPQPHALQPGRPSTDMGAPRHTQTCPEGSERDRPSLSLKPRGNLRPAASSISPTDRCPLLVPQ